MARDNPRQKYVIFDLDGTLININSISQLIGDWDEFHKASCECPPNEAMVAFAQVASELHPIIVVTGKPETFRGAVLKWLNAQGLDPDFLMMRPLLDTRSDAELKPARLEKLLGADWRDQVAFAVEDRDKMVDAWRKLGVTCLQCAESLY